ncbi:uncharacterized protein LOC103941081 [Pyrus x bretschneideri]|uniref:uncharacterized protein LOC103941081 n=1 Tax=Pyrus x bretschneideri TaxID=225117 RepID=UPI002030D22C|nr:uncharacterized protein LOC103941081 [Pyrus x bretschneideri]
MSSLNLIQTLNGTNYKKWRQDIEITLGLIDFDLGLRENEPTKPTDDAIAEKKNEYEKWVKANRIALMVIKRSMSDLVRGTITELDNAKAYLDSIEAKFKESEKVETGTLMNTLITTKYLGGDVREHILSMVDVAAKLNALNIKIDDPFLVHLALNSLPYESSKRKMGLELS